MAANTDPIYSRISDVQAIGPIITAASVVHDGSGTIATDVYKVFTADATNGGFVQKVLLKYVANAATVSVAAVMKFYISSATSGAVTNANAWLIGEVALPAITPSTTATMPDLVFNVGFALPASYTLLAKVTVSQSANTGWMAVAIGGKY